VDIIHSIEPPNKACTGRGYAFARGYAPPISVSASPEADTVNSPPAGEPSRWAVALPKVKPKPKGEKSKEKREKSPESKL